MGGTKTLSVMLTFTCPAACANCGGKTVKNGVAPYFHLSTRKHGATSRIKPDP
jgi:hypothetical protein